MYLLILFNRWCEKKRDIIRTVIASEEDMKRFDLKYKIAAKNHPFTCVTSSYEYAGFERTFSDDWNGFWGKGRLEGIKKLNKY